MAGKKWDDSEDEIIRTNFWDMDAQQIAAMLPGRTVKSVRHRAKALGLRKSPQDNGRLQSARWNQELEARLGEPIAQWLNRRYVEEKATYREITTELGINTRTLMRLMRESNIEPISPDEAVKRMIDNNPDFLANSMHRPDAIKRGAITRAKWRQENWRKFSSDKELDLLAAFNAAGLEPVPQLAFKSFNIDFAFPEKKLAVELDPRWHRSPRKRPMDAKKDKALKAAGWSVLRLDDRRKTSFNVTKVKRVLKSAAAVHP